MAEWIWGASGESLAQVNENLNIYGGGWEDWNTAGDISVQNETGAKKVILNWLAQDLFLEKLFESIEAAHL